MTAIPGTIVAAKVTTGDTATTYPVADTNELYGGLKYAADATARNAIPTPRLPAGTMCWQVDTNKLWEWNGSAWIDPAIYLGPQISPYIIEPFSTRQISNKFSTFAPSSICEYTKAGVTKVAAFGNAGSYAVMDPSTGVWVSGIIAALSAKTLTGAFYASTIDRFILIVSTGELYSINPNTTPWTVDQSIITGSPAANPNTSLIELTGHNEFAIIYNSTFIRKYSCATTTISLVASYDPSGGANALAQIGYDAVGDNIYASVANVGLGVGVAQGRLFKIPRGTFASNAAGTDPNNQNPTVGSAPLLPLAVAGGFVYVSVIGNTLGMQWDAATQTPKKLYGVIGGAASKFVAHPNGFMYGLTGQSGAYFCKLDPAIYGYSALRPVDSITGTGATAKDIFVASDGYIYALVNDSAGNDIYQLNQ